MSDGDLYRYTAFSDDPAGGNPAGVWIGRTLPAPAVMQRIAAEVGYSETAFVAPQRGPDRQVRYYSPLAEVAFCGHATIATGVALASAEGAGTFRLQTAVGEVPVRVERDGRRWRATLTSVDTRQAPVSDSLLAQALDLLGWQTADLDPQLPPIRAFAGAWHLVLAVTRRERLHPLRYDFEALRRIMLDADLTTLQLVWRETPNLYHSRNPFPVGGVVEDPATGAAAAALGGYLRDAGLLPTPAALMIRQGEDMGRPSVLELTIPQQGGIDVSGHAVRLEDTGR